MQATNVRISSQRIYQILAAAVAKGELEIIDSTQPRQYRTIHSCRGQLRQLNGPTTVTVENVCPSCGLRTPAGQHTLVPDGPLAAEALSLTLPLSCERCLELLDVERIKRDPVLLAYTTAAARAQALATTLELAASVPYDRLPLQKRVSRLIESLPPAATDHQRAFGRLRAALASPSAAPGPMALGPMALAAASEAIVPFALDLSAHPQIHARHLSGFRSLAAAAHAFAAALSAPWL